MVGTLREILGFGERSYQLTVPRSEENEGLLLLGDPGTGKSQVIHSWTKSQDANPHEAVVCYDPAGEFIERHCDSDRDIVLNPLDLRCPQWRPCYDDLGSFPMMQFLAESFFPCPEHSAANTQFFIKAARSIFAQLLTFTPGLVRWMKHESCSLRHCKD